MKILVTGASGMLGRALVEKLLEQPAVSLLLPTRQELNYLDQQAVRDYFNRHQPDFVYHLAAKVGGIAANMADPVGFFYENMQINLNVIHAAHAAGVKQLVNVGSSCMYPRNREVLKEEDFLTGELEPTNEGYAISKIASVLFCKYLSEQDVVRYKTVIPCNLYGEHDHFDLVKAHLVPAVIRKLHEAKLGNKSKVVIWGDGQARREFMHVADLVSALIKALQDYEAMPMLMNLGLGYDYSINEYYEIAAKVIGYQGSFKHDLTKPAGMQKKMVNIDRAKKWGWSAKISIEDGISQVYNHAVKQQLF